MKITSRFITIVMLLSSFTFTSCGGGGNDSPVTPTDTTSENILVNIPGDKVAVEIE